MYSDKEAWYAEEAADGNSIAVQALNSRPQIEPYQQFVWSAFWDLVSDRQIGMGGVGPIQFSSIDRYARRFGVTDPDQFRRFLRVIRALDARYVATVSEVKS